MEFQDRRRRSLRVQFWLLVEGLKDPLEDVEDEGQTSALPPPSATTVATTRGDVKMIWDAYFASSNSLNSNQKYLRTINAFLDRPATDLVSAQELRRVRHAVFAAQQDVLVEMEEEDFPEFAKSDLYFKAIADLPKTPSSPTIVRPRALSNPQTPLARQVPYQPPRSASPPPRAASPPPFTKGLQQLQLQRTDTAPPQVTFRAAFDQGRQRPVIARRSGSEGPPMDQPGGLFGDGGSLFGDSEPTVRKTSITSLDSGSNTFDKRRPNLADSLEFLMGSPSPAAEDFRSPLFGDEGLSRDGEAEHGVATGEAALDDDDYVQVQTIEAIQEALNSILATDARGASTSHHRSSNSLVGLDQSSSAGGTRRVSAETGLAKISPTRSRNSTNDSPPTPLNGTRIASGSSSKSIVSVIDDPSTRRGRGVFDDEEDMDDLEPEDHEPEFDPKSIRLAAPGDLQLPVEIARLGATLEKLRNQEAVVGALIRKAELTGIASELKILTKSRESLRREVRALSFQKSQYESQDSENKLVPGRTSVVISGTTVGQQADGQSFQLYLVEVHQLAADGTFGSGWIVTRRYSEFATLHAGLRDKYIAARGLDFPSKRLVTSYSEGFIEQRRRGLEKYLQVRIDPSVLTCAELTPFFKGARSRAGDLSVKRAALLHVSAEYLPPFPRPRHIETSRIRLSGSRTRPLLLPLGHFWHRRHARHWHLVDDGHDHSSVVSTSGRALGSGRSGRTRRGPRRAAPRRRNGRQGRCCTSRLTRGGRRGSHLLHQTHLRSLRHRVRAQGEEQLASSSGHPHRLAADPRRYHRAVRLRSLLCFSALADSPTARPAASSAMPSRCCSAPISSSATSPRFRTVSGQAESSSPRTRLGLQLRRRRPRTRLTASCLLSCQVFFWCRRAS